MDDVYLDSEIAVNKIGRILTVGPYTADFGGSQKNIFGLLGFKERLNGRTIS